MPTIMENGKLKNLSVAEYNKYVASLRANLKLNEDGTLKSHKVEDLDKIWVNGEEFSGMSYQGFLTVNTKTYVEEPTRANDGSIPNINDYDTFVVPRCKVNFKFFSIDDYRRLCNAVQSNEFVVKYYDKQFNDFVSHKMYCEPEEMVKLYNIGIDVIGVVDYEISFIGTLNDLNTYKVTYISEGSSISGNPEEYDKEKTYYKGDRVMLGNAGIKYSLIEESYVQNSGVPLSADYDGKYTLILFKNFDVDLNYRFTCSNPAELNEIVEGKVFYRKSIDGVTLIKYEVIHAPNSWDSELQMAANVTTYSLDVEYNLNDVRYFEAIFFENKFSNKDLTNTKYWLKHNLYQYSETTYNIGDVVYEQLENGRKYYICKKSMILYRPLTDTDYWQPISVKTYSSEVTYTSNKLSTNDTSQGQFVISNEGNAIYEAIYYLDEFVGKDPTNTTYWKQLAIGTGIEVKWGKSIIVADPEELFTSPNNRPSNKWNTNPNGTGYSYYPNQSLNVFKDLNLYAIWE